MRVRMISLVEVTGALFALHIAMACWVYLSYIPGIEQSVAELNSVDAERFAPERLKQFTVESIQQNAVLWQKAVSVYLVLFALLFGMALWIFLRPTAPATQPPENPPTP